jgi:hypothetical protein
VLSRCAEHARAREPRSFATVYVATAPQGFDKVNAATEAALKADPLAGPPFGSTR